MSINYNEKFINLKKKLESLSYLNTSKNQINSMYLTKLNSIEISTNSRLNTINENLNSLKDDFISLTNDYSKKNNLNQTQKIKYPFITSLTSFDYPSYQKITLIENDANSLNTDIFKNISNNFDQKLSEFRDENENYINSKFFDLENKLQILLERKIEEKNNIKGEILSIKNDLESNIENINNRVNEAQNENENILSNLYQSFNKEMNNVQNLIKENADKENETENMKNEKLEELKEFVTNKFSSERKKRENFQKNIFLILDDACKKLKENFNGEEEEENEEDDERKIPNEGNNEYLNDNYKNMEINLTNDEKDDDVKFDNNFKNNSEFENEE